MSETSKQSSGHVFTDADARDFYADYRRKLAQWEDLRAALDWVAREHPRVIREMPADIFYPALVSSRDDAPASNQEMRSE